MNKILKSRTCLYCKSRGDENNQGLVVLDTFICFDCEQQMIKSNCQEASYPDYINGIKKMWYCWAH